MKNRHSIRLKEYDYSGDGAYFITICTKNREMLFGEIINGKMKTDTLGDLVISTWESLSDRFPIDLGPYQIMPNHFHGIIMIVGAHHDAPAHNRAIHESPLHRSLLSQIIGFLKMNSSKSIHQINGPQFVWQRNFYEHIIRNESEYEKITWYIVNNPLIWDRDRNNLENIYV